MQKRARAVETKMRRSIKRANRQIDNIKDSGISLPLAYLRLAFLWVSIISLDMVVGFRFELLWPSWLMIRACYEAWYRSSGSNVIIPNNDSAVRLFQRYSILFVCVTATSDLICYLFIPVRILIFMASTYVWMNLIWSTHGGFLRTISTIYGDRAQGFMIILLWTVVIIFEFSWRVRCDFLVLVSKETNNIASYFAQTDQSTTTTTTDLGGCAQVQGMGQSFPRNLNYFFGAHSIGFPIVIVSFSIQYYFNEWRQKKKQVENGKKNEQLYKLLVEALPADYDGPKDYTKPCNPDDADCYMLEGPSQVAAILPSTSAHLLNGTTATPSTTTSTTTPTPTTTTTPSTTTTTNGITNNMGNTHNKKNGYHKSHQQNGKHKNGKGGRSTNETPPVEKKTRDKKRPDEVEDDENSDDEYSFKEPSTGGVSIVRFVFDILMWTLTAVGCFALRKLGLISTTTTVQTFQRDEEDSVVSLLHDDKHKHNNKEVNKNRSTPNTTGRGNNTAKKNNNGHLNHQNQRQKPEKTIQMTNGHNRQTTLTTTTATSQQVASTRDSSRETNLSNDNNNETNGTLLELEKMRTELHHAKSQEADMRIQLSLFESNEALARQDAAHMRSRLEQVEAGCKKMEKLRDMDRNSLEQLEKKYAELMNRKNDVERDLMLERKARKEDGGKRNESAEQLREKERVLEREVDRLRDEVRVMEERGGELEAELQQLRKYKEENDIDSVNMDLRIWKEKTLHLESSLASENKLKQELFRALGEAKGNNAELESRVEELERMLSEKTTTRNNCSHHHHHHHRQDDGMLSPLQTNPPPYHACNQSLQHSKGSPGATNPLFGGDFLYRNSFQTSPTGEHLLFDTPQTSSCQSALSAHDILASRMGKFGAPSNPSTRSN